MGAMFRDAGAFNQPLTLDTSKVTLMGMMFRDADAFNQPVGSWNTASVTSMYCTFHHADAFNQDLSSRRIDSVTDMGSMFFNAAAFDQYLCWDLSGVSNTENMFDNCPFSPSASCPRSFTSKAELSIASLAWVTNASGAEATYGHISTWDTSAVTDMEALFCDNTWSTHCSFYNSQA